MQTSSSKFTWIFKSTVFIPDQTSLPHIYAPPDHLPGSSEFQFPNPPVWPVWLWYPACRVCIHQPAFAIFFCERAFCRYPNQYPADERIHIGLQIMREHITTAGYHTVMFCRTNDCIENGPANSLYSTGPSAGQQGTAAIIANFISVNNFGCP